MKNILKDKYFLICVSSVLLLVLAWSAINTDNDENTERISIGIVFNVRETDSGFVFSIEMSDGTIQRCYYSTEPEEFGLYSVKGDFSDDGKMFFIKEMTFLEYQ